MLRIIGLLVAMACLGVASEWQLHQNLVELDKACASGACQASAGAAHQAEPLVIGLHGIERTLIGVLVLLTLGIAMIRVQWICEVASMFWAIGFVFLLLSAGLAVGFEIIADGTELQWGFRPSLWNSIELSAAIEGIGILCAVVALCCGPPRGWNGDQDLSLI